MKVDLDDLPEDCVLTTDVTTVRAVLDHIPDSSELPVNVRSFFEKLLYALDEAQGEVFTEAKARSFTVIEITKA